MMARYDDSLVCAPTKIAQLISPPLSLSQRDLKWKRVQRAGGDFTQSDDWLRLYAAEKQARTPNTT